jgi:hypothetical protein
MHPDEHQKKVEEQIDNSKSAQRERQLLADQAEKEEAERKEKSWKRRIMRKLTLNGGEKDKSTTKEKQDADKHRRKKVLSRPGLDVESGIPPGGKRDKLESVDTAPAVPPAGEASRVPA